MAQIPDASQLGWHSNAESLFATRLDELSTLMKDAVAVLNLADAALGAQVERIEAERMAKQHGVREAAARSLGHESAGEGADARVR